MFILFMDIGGYYIRGYQWLFIVIILVVIGGYWWLLYQWPLVVIGGYSINGYWWILVVINVIILVVTICYIMTIGDYSIINYC